jgi:23S rRNA pseudouridine1911/1915/1917 synthase
VHLAAAGTPIVGDRLYGAGGGPFGRHALHCASLSFIHPVTFLECRIEAEPPDDMKELIAALSKQ